MRFNINIEFLDCTNMTIRHNQSGVAHELRRTAVNTSSKATTMVSRV